MARKDYEYGWNDPPQFAYVQGGGVVGGGVNRKLNKRPNYPADQKPKNTTVTESDIPPSSLPPPSLPPSSLPPPSLPKDDSSHIVTTPITSEQENTIPILQSHVMTPLCELLESFKDKMEERVYKEIRKRLDVLGSQWDKLPVPVHNRLSHMITALNEKDFKQAESIHTALMVDHITEVKQWLMGVKKLVTIATEQNSLNNCL